MFFKERRRKRKREKNRKEQKWKNDSSDWEIIVYFQ